MHHIYSSVTTQSWSNTFTESANQHENRYCFLCWPFKFLCFLLFIISNSTTQNLKIDVVNMITIRDNYLQLRYLIRLTTRILNSINHLKTILLKNSKIKWLIKQPTHNNRNSWIITSSFDFMNPSKFKLLIFWLFIILLIYALTGIGVWLLNNKIINQ